MMSGIASGSWSLVNFVLLRAIGAWSGWMNAGRWEEIFWLIALLPAAGIGHLAGAQPESGRVAGSRARRRL